MIERVQACMAEHRRVIAAVEKDLKGAIVEWAQTLVQLYRSGGKVLVMGNGGSAADAQHLAAELVGRFLKNRSALPAIALTTDSSILTAVGNDFGFDAVFARQVEALAAPGDLVIGISTSGNSPNVLRALQEAAERGCRTAALLGGDGGKIAAQVEQALVIPSRETPRIQEAHSLVIHILCDLVEASLFPG